MAWKFFSELSEGDIRKLLGKLQIKSCELDLIPTYILKQQSDYFITTLTKILNLSLLNSEFDISWKCAILRPLIKKADGQVEIKLILGQ